MTGETTLVTVFLSVLLMLVWWGIARIMLFVVPQGMNLKWARVHPRWKYFLQFLTAVFTFLFSMTTLGLVGRSVSTKLFDVAQAQSLVLLLSFLWIAGLLGVFMVNWYRGSQDRRTRRAIYYCTGLVLIIGAVYLTPPLQQTLYASDQSSWWYDILFNIRGNRVPDTSRVVLVEYSRWPGEERFLKLISALDHYQPSVIAFGFTPWNIISTYDETAVDRLRRSVSHARLVVTGDWFHRFDLTVGDMTAEFAGWMISRENPPMCYSPGSNDLAIVTAQTYLGKESVSVPVAANGFALINHYVLSAHESGKSPFVTIWFDGEHEAGETISRGWFMNQFVRDYKWLRFHVPQGVIEESDSGNVWEAADLSVLKDKIIVLNVPSQMSMRVPLGLWSWTGGGRPASFEYATMIQNILDANFITSPGKFGYLLAGVLLTILGAAFFLRLNPWKALAATLALDIITMGAMIILFLQLQLFVPISFLIIANAGVLLLFLPYEIATERSRFLQEQTRLSTELNAAREMQMGLMPKEDPVVRGFDISGICLPANEVGGDFFDYVWLDDRKTKLGIAVADVSGKAMRAAITAVMTSGMIYQEIENGGSPKRILRKINKPLYMKIDDRMFTALSFAVLDIRKKELRFSNAGQMYPALHRNGRVMMLEVKGARLPLGIKENVPYNELVVKLKRGDTIVFYTDGIPEAKNDQDDFYGFERFKELVAKLDGSSAREIRDRILDDVKSFTGQSPQYDDMTVVVMLVL